MDPNPPTDQPQDQNKTDSQTPKQSVVARVQQAQNVLVTVKSNPNVDELAATIGLTLMLNKLGKHATAVFSGEVPNTLEFLKPEATLESNTDSLRDFIVSLDKSKADKLRYKVEENVVKIFITPYRTSITQDDLEFTQGEFNVDVVLALGVTQREELDQAITAHGRILHDASVITVTVGQDYSELGQINWQEATASSLSEMLVSISEAFQGGLIDEQIATAFLTGIVSETERFSNPKTSPKVMTMAAQLMAAGANQQLIANELEKAVEVDFAAPAAPVASEPAESTASEDGSLTIAHEEPAPAELPKPEEAAPEPAEQKPEEELLLPPSARETDEYLPTPAPSELEKSEFVEPLMDAEKPSQEPAPAPEEPKEDVQKVMNSILPGAPKQSAPGSDIHIDEFGNLSKPTVEPRHKTIQPLPAAEEAKPEPVAEQPASTGLDLPAPVEEPKSEQPATDNQTSKLPPPPVMDMTPPPDIKDSTTIEEIEESVNSPHVQAEAEKPAQAPAEGVDSARDAVTSALGQNDFSPAGQPRADLNAMPLGTPPPSTSYDSYRLEDHGSGAPKAPVTDVSGHVTADTHVGQSQDGQMPPPPVPPPMLPH